MNYLPLETRIQLHRKVGELRGLGLSYAQILELVFRRQHVRLSKSTVSVWTRGIHSPNGRLNSFLANPTPELAYVIGVILSDGNLNIHGYSAELILAVTDYEFAEEFSRCLGIVLQRKHPYTVRWHARKNRWVVQGSSVLLYNFLHRDWRNFRKWIEHCDKCTASFLKAFYDGEGCISGRHLMVFNTDMGLLLYAKHLLNSLGVGTLEPRLVSLAGTSLKDPRTGKLYKRRKDCYRIDVQGSYLARFKTQVGFTINRKAGILRKKFARTDLLNVSEQCWIRAYIGEHVPGGPFPPRGTGGI